MRFASATFLRRLRRRHESVARQLAGAEAPPLALAPGTTLKLADWSPEVGSGKATLEKQTQAGRDALGIQATAAGTAASWRKNLLLAPGRYRFEARVRVAGVSPAGREPGAGVRISGGRAAKRIVSAEGWTALEHLFIVREGEEDVQFVCELRGGEGQAWFEVDSLLLRREEEGKP